MKTSKLQLIEVVSKPRITPEGKAQADSKAQQPRQYVSIAKRPAIPPWRDHRVSNGVMKSLLLYIAVKFQLVKAGLTLQRWIDTDGGRCDQGAFWNIWER
jgi:hypothetical protein